MVTNLQSKVYPLDEHIELKIKREVWSFIGVVLLHVLALLLFRYLLSSEILKFSEANQVVPIELEIIPTHYVEVNPKAAENQPDKSQWYSFQDQQAADTSLKENNSSVPLLEGDEVASLKIVSGEVQTEDAELPSGVYQLAANESASEAFEASQAQPVTKAEAMPSLAEIASSSQINPFQASEDESGVDVITFKDKEEFISENTKQKTIIPMTQDLPSLIPQDIAVSEKNRPVPMARPKLSSEITTGPIMHTVVSADKIGIIALDASFSEFGEYEQQFYSALQVGWYNELAFYKPMDSGTQVSISFILKSDGTIDSVTVLSSTAGLIATTICESAIVKRSPFRPWTQDMIHVFGDQKELRVRFYYR